MAAIRFARESGLELAVRGGGHSLAGLSVCDDGIVVDLSPMRDIDVDADARVARVEAGATWADFDAATQAEGLASTGGLISHTGVAGLTLGGGIGWLMRKHGLACDNLIAADLVTAAGDVVRASSAEEPELLWGLRGGGGNFGVVTSFEFRLHPVGPVLGGLMAFPFDRGGEVLRTYREWAAELPDAFTTIAAVDRRLLPRRSSPRSSSVASWSRWPGVGAMNRMQGRRTSQPLRDLGPAIDVFGPMPYTVLQGMLDEGAPPGIRAYTRSGYTADLADGFNRRRARATAGRRWLRPLQAILICTTWAAPSPGWERATPRSGTDAPRTSNNINLDGGMDHPPRMGGCHRRRRTPATVFSAFRPLRHGWCYVNFLGKNEGDARVRAAYGDAPTTKSART